MNRTIIYYTANREQEAFESKVRERILSVKGDIPIVSVSQKPIGFGKNICVGDVGHTYLNAFRQLLIGCEEATTDYVVMAEADCLYPPTGYFDYEPKSQDLIYTYDNVWVLWKNGKCYHYKEQTHGSIIYGRKFIIDLLYNSFKGLPTWSRKKVGFPFYNKTHKFEHFTGTPIISVKTGNGVQKGTHLDKSIPPKRELDYWGAVADVKRKIFYE